MGENSAGKFVHTHTHTTFTHSVTCLIWTQEENESKRQRQECEHKWTCALSVAYLTMRFYTVCAQFFLFLCSCRSTCSFFSLSILSCRWLLQRSTRKKKLFILSKRFALTLFTISGLVNVCLQTCSSFEVVALQSSQL